MQLRYTRYQIPRGSRADAATFDTLFLIKNVSVLRATYQVRLLAFNATEARKRLVIKVPKHCRVHPTLRELITQLPNTVRVEKV